MFVDPLPESDRRDICDRLYHFFWPLVVLGYLIVAVIMCGAFLVGGN